MSSLNQDNAIGIKIENILYKFIYSLIITHKYNLRSRWVSEKKKSKIAVQNIVINLLKLEPYFLNPKSLDMWSLAIKIYGDHGF